MPADATLFCAEIPETGQDAVLDAAEAHHAVRVRRLRAGDPVRLIDGRGSVAYALVQGVKPALSVKVLERDIQAPPPRPLHVAAALPKGDRQATLLDMLTQLGMASFTPLECEHSVVRPGSSAALRWRRVCIEACKQSGNAYLPTIHDACSPVQAVAALRRQNAVCLLAHPAARSGTVHCGPDTPLGLFIGPEGGFTEAEVEAAGRQGAMAIALCRYTLRIETAAVAWAGAIRLNLPWAPGSSPI